MRFRFFALLTLLFAAGCGDDDGTANDPSCGAVCARISSLCGPAPPGCEAACGNFSASTRSCIVAASACSAVDRCTQPTLEGGVDAAVDATPDARGSCDGVPFCSDPDTAAVCENNVTQQTPCNGRPCAGGRCGACETEADCRDVRYRCRCSDGQEITGSADLICGDSQGAQRWCSPPSIAASQCATGAFEDGFGYLGAGCVSIVDPP
ncbi:MAG: hypothetical protein AAGF12_23770 [Myxococcota bacterium]